MAVERLFGIDMNEADLATIRTVGDLFDLILRKVGPRQSRACLTQAAFYRMRRTLPGVGPDVRITPDTPLARALEAPVRRSSLRTVWRELEAGSQLKLPSREIHSPTWLVENVQRWPRLSAALAIMTAGFAMAAFQNWAGITDFVAFCTGIALAGFFFAVLAVLRHVFGTVPRSVESVGDLVREAAGRSFASLRDQKGGFSPNDLWWALVAILRNNSDHAGPIDRDTNFFAKVAAIKPA